MMVSGVDALERIAVDFPEIRKDLSEYEGLLHVQFGSFSRYMQSLIDDRNIEGFKRACNLFVEIYPNSSPELENAFNVSFLENIGFEGEGQWAYKEMPDLMRIAWEEMREYNDKLHSAR